MAARKRGAALQFLAQNFARYVAYATRCDLKKEPNSRRVEWFFPNADATVGPLHNYFNPDTVKLKGSSSLVFYNATRFSGVKTLLKGVSKRMLPYKYCAICGKPSINEANLSTLRKRLFAYVGCGGLFSGAIGAAALPLLGFGSAGVAAGSTAAAWQSSLGLAASGSVFALLQSLGATGTGIILFGSVGTVAGGGALGLIAKFASQFNWCKCKLKIFWKK